MRFHVIRSRRTDSSRSAGRIHTRRYVMVDASPRRVLHTHSGPRTDGLRFDGSGVGPFRVGRTLAKPGRTALVVQSSSVRDRRENARAATVKRGQSDRRVMTRTSYDVDKKKCKRNHGGFASDCRCRRRIARRRVRPSSKKTASLGGIGVPRETTER